MMSLDGDGVLRMEILPALKTLRAGELPYQEIRAGVCRILPRATGEILCTAESGKDFLFRMSDGALELLKVTYDAGSHSFLADGKTIALQAGDAPVVHGYVDGSVIELILGERIGYTKRFYYVEAVAPDIEVVANGAGMIRMDAWKIAPISDNRLTTRART
jgi:beta-fructofuranosidase